jgi:putative Holliday junction resolvase
MRLLGIDFGTKRIGIALTEEEGTMAFPFSVIKNEGSFVKIASAIEKICQEKAVGKIVLGLSLDYKNQPNEIVAQSNKLKEMIEKQTGLPVLYHQEVLTTKEAQQGQGRVDKIDASAATIILQSFIDSQNMLK